MSRFRLFILASLACVTAEAVAAPPFALGDSDPGSAYFKKRFLASYGVNEKVEPVLSQEDRPLYERILPHLEKNPQEAFNILRREVNKDSNAAFDFLLGSLAYQMDRLPEARNWMSSAIAKFPSFSRAHRTLALIHVREGEFAKAIAPLRSVIALGGGDAQSYGLLAYCQLSQENYRSALSAYGMARMFDADSMDFKRGEAHCLLMLQNYREAVGLFDELIRERPQETDFWMLQANAFLALEQYDRAITNLEVVKGLGKATVESMYLLGDLYIREDIPQLALQSYLGVLNQDKDIQLDKALRALGYFSERSYVKEARIYLDQLKKHLGQNINDSQKIELAQAEALLFQQQGEHHKAIDLLLPIVNKDPLNGTALLRLAESYQAIEEYEKAEFYLERAVSISDKQVDALIGLARLAVHRGQLLQGLNYLRRAQQIRHQEHVAQYIERLERSL